VRNLAMLKYAREKGADFNDSAWFAAREGHLAP
jgi:hypothetical protein